MTRREPLAPDLSGVRAVKIIGLGGVGGIVARFLIMFLAASRATVRVVLIDGDEFELDNAQRMFFSRCGNKAAVLKDDLIEHIEGSRLTLIAVEEFVTPENLPRLVQEGDVVILAVDNHATRKLVSDFCARERRDVVLISGGNDGVGQDSTGYELRGTYGNVQIHVRRDDRDESPTITRFHPEIATPEDRLPTDLSCTAALASTPQLLFTNLAAASCILNAFLLHVCGALHYSELCFEIYDGLMRPMMPLAGPGARPKPASSTH